MANNPTTSSTEDNTPDLVTFQDESFRPITEGQATILFPTTNEVFYNSVQQFNRDMSIAAIRTWGEIYLEEQRVRAERKAQRRRKSKKPNTSIEETAINTQTTEEPTIGESLKDQRPGFKAPVDFTILEALSATGLRSIRYAKEIPQVRWVVANDLEPDAVKSIRRNVEYNQLDETKVRPNLGDACAVMYAARGDTRQQFHVVDLDPYGTASPFLDAAVQAVTDGGLLCVTCTDLAVLAGSNYPEVCFAKYGGTPVKAGFCHEMALRLLLHAIQTSAARYKRYIVPMISCSIDFYIRVFVRVYTGPAQVKKSMANVGVVYTCPGCHSFHTNAFGRITSKNLSNDPATVNANDLRFHVHSGPTTNTQCPHCGQKQILGGPAWLSPIHDPTFVERMYQLVKATEGTKTFGTRTRMLGMIKVISEELPLPFFYTLAALSGTIHCNSPPLLKLCSALLNAGYQVSGSHTHPGSIKTNAPGEIMWDIMRCWVKDNPVKLEKYGSESPAHKILGQPVQLAADFKIHPQANPESRKVHLVRYQENPEKNWGPKAKHTRAPKRKA
ncbi:RNA methyltransferase tRNA(m5U54)methyltransferase [Dispira simplex]|nr:RNA methyltransferase tRNA(m5U54)methyltransferase [Dispira simplex]